MYASRARVELELASSLPAQLLGTLCTLFTAIEALRCLRCLRCLRSVLAYLNYTPRLRYTHEDQIHYSRTRY